jgi:hypothetical protein
MKTLNEIGLYYNTDKSSIVHDYLWKYEKYFPFEKTDKLKILEIGVLNGSSLKTWKEYYKNSNVIGIDINPDCIQFNDERITIEIGSQDNKEFLEYVGKKHGPFDLIIDDGSHINNHVIFSFKNLFKFVKPSGLYVIEDSVTSYWSDYGGSPNGTDTMISYFKNTIDEVNFGGELADYPNGKNAHARKDEKLINQFNDKGYDKIGIDFESLNFLNSIIIITKRKNLDKNLIIATYDKEYSWIKYLKEEIKICIYNKKSKNNEKEILLKNIGLDVHSYFYHIYHNYFSLSKYTFFSQDQPFDHVENYIDIINGDVELWDKHAIQKDNGYWIFNTDFKQVLCCESSGLPHDPKKLNVAGTWKLIFENEPPELFYFTPATHFILSREKIYENTLEFYGNILKILETNEKAPWEIERLLSYIFMNNDLKKIKY